MSPPPAEKGANWLSMQLPQASTAAPVVRTAEERQAIANMINFNLPAGDSFTSQQVISALEKIDIHPLVASGLWPVAVLDFDNTLMHGDVFDVFIRFLVAKQALKEEAKAGFIEELSHRASSAQVDSLRALPMNAAMASVVEIFDAGDVSLADLYFLSVRALKGMRSADVERFARELYRSGGAGFEPYKHRVYDPTPAAGDSAKDLVATMQAKGVDCFIITAGLEMLARAGAGYLGIAAENVIGAKLEEKNGRLTGKACNIPALGKDNIVHEQLGTIPLFAFGDSYYTDKPMLNTCLVKGFMVGAPDEFVRRTQAAKQCHVGLMFEGANGQHSQDPQHRWVGP